MVRGGYAMCFTLHRMGMKGENCYRDENVCVCVCVCVIRLTLQVETVIIFRQLSTARLDIVRDSLSLSFFHIHSCLFSQAGEMLSLAFKIMNVSRRDIKTIDHFGTYTVIVKRFMCIY